MKRYHLFFDGNTDGAFWRDVEEDPDGEWVRAEDALKLKAVVEALPMCDEHHNGAWHSLPYAEALRALEKP